MNYSVFLEIKSKNFKNYNTVESSSTLDHDNYIHNYTIGVMKKGVHWWENSILIFVNLIRLILDTSKWPLTFSGMDKLEKHVEWR